MDTQFLVSVVVVVVMQGVFGYVVHGVLLSADYHASPVSSLYRSDANQRRHLPMPFPAHIAAAIAMVWLYRRAQAPGSWAAEGIQFGVAIAVLMTVHKFIAYYTVQPIPGRITVKQITFDSIAAILMGLVIAALNR